MAGRISRIPQGLLGLLDLKTMGESPEVLASQLVPVIEALPFYINSLAEQTYTASQAPAQGFNVCTQLGTFELGPGPGVMWYVRSWQIVAATIAASTLGGFHACIIPALQNGAPTFGAYGGNTVNLAALQADSSFAEGFWMQPGDKLGYYCGYFTGTVAIQGMALVAQFPY